jgi:Leucine-rich repeat (LRR) protein
MNSVPIDIIKDHIFIHLDIVDQNAFMRVCKLFYCRLFIRRMVWHDEINFVTMEVLNYHKFEQLEVLNLDVLKINHFKHNLDSLMMYDIGKFAKLKSLNLIDINVLQTDIDKLTNLEELHTSSVIITSVNKLPKLRILICHATSGIDQEGIAHCYSLESLSVCNENIRSIIGLTNLQSLTISKAHITDIGSCTKLTELIILSSKYVCFADFTKLLNLRKFVCKEPLFWLNRNISIYKNLETLELSNVTSQHDFYDVNCFKKLRKLKVQHMDLDQEAINDLENLEVLWCTAISISSVNHLRKLRELRCAGSGIDQEGIKHCTNLEELHIDNESKIYSLHLPKLKILVSKGAKLVKDGLKDCVNLKFLTLYKTDCYVELNHLTKLKILSVDINSCTQNEICNLQLVESFMYLNNLPEDFGRNHLHSVNHFKFLRELHCEGNYNINQNGIEKCYLLEILDCRYNKNITSVNHLTKLKYLYCIGSGITQEGISELKNLRKLVCSNCPEINSIDHLKKLRTLICLGETGIPDFQLSKFSI